MVFVEQAGSTGGGKRKRTPIIIAVVVALMLVVGAAVTAGVMIHNNNEREAAYQDAMDRGYGYLDDEAYKKAARAFEDALDVKPGDPEATLALAEAQLGKGDLDDANDTLDLLGTLKDSTLLDKLAALRDEASLSLGVSSVDTSAFPLVKVTLDIEGDAEGLTAADFLVREGEEKLEVAGCSVSGRQLVLTYYAPAAASSVEARAPQIVLNRGGSTRKLEAGYTTPRLSPASVRLVSTDLSDYPTVRVYYRIEDPDTGGTIDALPKQSFTLQERLSGGAYLAREVRSASQLDGNAGLAIDLVADKSSSIGSYAMDQIKSVMTEFVSGLQYQSGDIVEVLAFDTSVAQMCAFTQDLGLLKSGIGNMYANGSTALYDALMAAVNRVTLQSGARCVIAFTDGQDNQSSNSAYSVIDFADSCGVPVYLIGVGSELDASMLQRIAGDTGGRYWNINDLYDLQDIYGSIYTEQKSLYCIEYESDLSLDQYATRQVSLSFSGDGYQASCEETFTPQQLADDNAGVDVKDASSRYELIMDDVSWEQAKILCEQRGGHLATVTSQAEMDTILSLAQDAEAQFVWLGGYTSFDADGSVFGHWVTGEDFTYEMWHPGEPSRLDQDGTEERYIMLWNIESLGGWGWNDIRNDPAGEFSNFRGKLAYVCEYGVR